MVIKKLRPDNATNCFNHTLDSFFKKEGIIHESSFVYTPQQNGVSKQKN